MATKSDYLIIGAGPAGLQLGYHLDRAGRNYRILESGPTPGTFFRTFPRHRQLISINKRHTGRADPEFNLRMDWNSLLGDGPLFTAYTRRYFPDAGDMVRYLADYAAANDLIISYDTLATRVERTGNDFTVTDQHGEPHTARHLIVATGLSRPYIPAIPGIELADGYESVSTDPDEFTDQRVLIIGKGNSAFETADNLVETAAVIHLAGPHAIRMAWQTHYVGHLRAVNNNFLDTYQLKAQNAVLDGTILNIERDGDGFVVTVSFSRAGEVTRDLRYDRVIRATGFRFDSEVFAEGTRPELVINDRFPAQTSAWESRNVPGLHFAGTVMQVRDFNESTSGFIHGFRYCVRALHRILEQRHHGVPWPRTHVGADSAALTDAVLARMNRSSALWQQFGYLGDVVVMAGDCAAYFEEVPVAYVHDVDLAAGADFVVITLEYGPDHDKVDPFDITVHRVRQNSTDDTPDAAYLHPVLRHFRAGAMLGVHHVAENLESDWTSETVHRAPLRAFFARQLALNDGGPAHFASGANQTSCV
jgi:thioredoxin reductase